MRRIAQNCAELRRIAQTVEGGEDPLVHDILGSEGALLVGGERGARLVQLRARALHEEAVRMVPRQEEVAHHLLHPRLLEPKVVGADDGRVDQVQPQRVGAVRVDDVLGRRVVLLSLRHLLAVLHEEGGGAESE